MTFYRGSPGYVDGSDTSEDAAMSVEGSASSMRERCRELIEASGGAFRTGEPSGLGGLFA